MRPAGLWARRSASPKRSAPASSLPLAPNRRSSANILRQAVLEGLRQKLEKMVPRVQRVMRQTTARIFAGATHAEGKIVSLFEPSTEVIGKGKAGKPTEFGKIIKLREAENQIVIGYQAYDQPPTDSPLLIPLIE